MKNENNFMMAVILNGIAQLEYDRNKPLPDHQALYLDKMDHKMDQGILLGDISVGNPDINQRAQFVAANLVHAIKDDEEATAASLCTYLAIRLPELKQINIEDDKGDISIELIFDRPYQQQVPVKFLH